MQARRPHHNKNSHLREYETVSALRSGLVKFFTDYNEARQHQSLTYRTPAAVYHERSTPLPRDEASHSRARGLPIPPIPMMNKEGMAPGYFGAIA